MAKVAIEHRLLALCAVAVAALVLASGGTAGRAQQPSTAAGRAILVDGHVHITNRVYWEGIDPWKAQTTGMSDYARSKQGGLDVIFENLWVQDQYNNYNYTVKQALRLTESFNRVLEANRDKMELALSAADVRRIVGSGKMAVILALEGGFDMEGDLDVLRLFHRLGVRLMQFANHDTTSAFADAGRGEKKWNGITEHGREVIREMNRLGIVIDIAHASDAAQLQIIDASAAPVVASHQGLRRFSEYEMPTGGPRTLSDEVLKALAAKGGLVGIHSGANHLSQKYWDWERARRSERAEAAAPQLQIQAPSGDYGQYIATLDRRVGDGWRRGYTRPWKEGQKAILDAGGPLPTLQDWTNQVAYAVQLVGDNHVGIGTDLNGVGVASLRDFDATGYQSLVKEMGQKSFSPETLRKLQGENWLRILDAARVTSNTSSIKR